MSRVQPGAASTLPKGLGASRSKGQEPQLGREHLQGRSQLFVSKADLELEVGGCVFPVHSDVMLLQCGLLLGDLIGQYGNAPAAEQRQPPRIVLSRATAPQRGGAPLTAAVVTAPSLQLLLNHLYQQSTEIKSEEDAVTLLQGADFFDAKVVKGACDQALTTIAKQRWEDDSKPPSASQFERAAVLPILRSLDTETKDAIICRMACTQVFELQKLYGDLREDFVDMVQEARR